MTKLSYRSGLALFFVALWPQLAAAQTANQVATGLNHSCARLTDGTVRCWGRNTSGQLGDGSTVASTTPVMVTGITTAASVVVGDNHSCAALSNGTVRCWGANNEGQLGDASSTNRSLSVAVLGLDNVDSIAAGSEHSCAVRTDGAVRCWGSNGDGRLGDGTISDTRSTPVAVVGITTATAVAAGDSHSCALLVNGTINCWGLAGYGQLGYVGADLGAYSTTPKRVANISNASAIALGYDHSCALLTTGTVSCWGGNFEGTIGDGTTTNRSLPVTVSGISNANYLTAGFDHTCARSEDGSLRCWGLDRLGELGDGVAQGNRPTPVLVQGAPAANTELALGDQHSCGVFNGVGVYCWGRNNDGELGNGSTTNSLPPVPVTGLSTVVVPANVPASRPLSLVLLATLLLATVMYRQRRQYAAA